MNLKPSILAAILPFAFISCSIKPQPIEYGKDQCDLCKMAIVDNKFGAELISTKGKIFKFDSDECLIGYLKKEKIPPTQYSHILVADFANPGTLVDAKKAVFLRGKNVQSPMGGNIASFGSPDDAKEQQRLIGGDLIHWDSALATAY